MRVFKPRECRTKERVSDPERPQGAHDGWTPIAIDPQLFDTRVLYRHEDGRRKVVEYVGKWTKLGDFK